MDWLLFLLGDPPTLTSRLGTFCTSCDEFVGKNCRKNLGTCRSRYPDFACQTKEVYIQHFTGEYSYQYSALGCPKRCVEYVRIARGQKNVFLCCNESYCNSLNFEEVPQSSIVFKK
uniref:UPAR/Ly6 domain-containing protein n=1 Tax=Ursus americanus TaxID=9643 RepID=A0A452R4V8_URSAM